MLAPAAEEEHPPARELPPTPDDRARQEGRAKVVAACFILAMLAGLGFLVAYFIFDAHSISAVPARQPGPGQHDVAGLPAARRRRHDLGPAPDAEGRADRAAAPAAVLRRGPGRVRGDLRGRRRGQPVRQAAADPPHPDRGHRAGRARADLPAARPRPAARQEPGPHGLAQGPAADRVRDEPADHPGRVQLARRHDQRRPRGLPERRRRDGQGGRDHHQVPARRAPAAHGDELDRQRHRRLLQDLHARGLPGRPVRADHPPHPVPLPPVDVRRDARRQGPLRPGRPGRCRSCRSPWTRRGS